MSMKIVLTGICVTSRDLFFFLNFLLCILLIIIEIKATPKSETKSLNLKNPSVNE